MITAGKGHNMANIVVKGPNRIGCAAQFERPSELLSFGFHQKAALQKIIKPRGFQKRRFENMWSYSVGSGFDGGKVDLKRAVSGLRQGR